MGEIKATKAKLLKIRDKLRESGQELRAVYQSLMNYDIKLSNYGDIYKAIDEAITKINQEIGERTFE
jgi:chemotaxis regulatin CheY-phosphate phosphatase CheZ